jgi:hypothetical protein
MKQKNFENVLMFALVAGCVIHPLSAALGLLVLLSSQAAERFFTRNVSDSDRSAIAALKVDMKKISEVQQKAGLAKAFGAQA